MAAPGDTPEPDKPQLPYSEVPPSLQEYVTALTGNDYILFQLWDMPTVPHPQNRSKV